MTVNVHFQCETNCRRTQRRLYSAETQTSWQMKAGHRMKANDSLEIWQAIFFEQKVNIWSIQKRVIIALMSLNKCCNNSQHLVAY